MSFKNQHYILIVILIMIFNQLKAQTLRTVETYHDWGKEHLHEVYTTLSEPPYRKHGTYKEYDEGTNLLREVNYKNGKKHGVSRLYYFVADNFQKACYGKLIGETHFKDGKKHGWDRSWRCNKGELKFREETLYADGKSDIIKLYHRNGNIKAEMPYEGTCKEWFETGELLMEYIMVDGYENGQKTVYHIDGHIFQQGNMIDGNPKGRWEVYNLKDGVYVKEVINID